MFTSADKVKAVSGATLAQWIAIGALIKIKKTGTDWFVTDVNIPNTASGTTRAILNDGSVTMLHTYTPKLPTDVVTLQYVSNVNPVGLGAPGEVGFGVGALSDADLPTGWSMMAGHHTKASANYGNVLDKTGSVMVWIPAFYFKWNVDNTVEVKDFHAFDTEAEANTAGFALHRAFIDDGKVQRGFFVDKYGCGNVGGVFTSKQGIDPCSTAVHFIILLLGFE